MYSHWPLTNYYSLMLKTRFRTILCALFSCLIMAPAFAQKQAPPATTSFNIEGRVKKPASYSLSALQEMKQVSVETIVIYNHLMEKKKELKQVKGILLTTLLASAEIESESPKNLSEYYITCIAADGYKVVFSWNELFNMKTGDQVLIITAQDGKSAESATDHIALISPADIATGRRYVKGLSKIIVSKVQ